MKWKVAAVIPNWNGAGRLERCLKSLEAQNRRFDQVIVVDNGSTDGSAELAQVRLASNCGFAVAVNRGITAAAGADWIAILNNDVVLHPAWLEMLLDSPDEFTMLTGRTLQMGKEGLLDGAGDALSLGLAAVRLGHGAPDGAPYGAPDGAPYGAPDGAPYDAPRPVFGVCFAAALIHADVFRRVGVLEERFFAYLEDAEFCLRAGLAGFRAWYEPMAVAWHEGGASSGGELSPNVVQWMTAHQLLLAARYASGEMWSRVAMVQTLWGARMLLRGRARPWMRGVADGVRQWSAMRDAFPVDRARVAALLLESEKLIRTDRCAKDLFWNFYFS